MKNALILHGAGNNSQGNWFPWLKTELEKRGFNVWVPDLPNSETPNVKAWSKVIFSNKNWKFHDESVLIGHSAGATFVLRIIEQLPDGTKVKKAILVAGPVMLGSKRQYFPYKEDMVKAPFDWKKINNSCRKFYLFYSDNDQYECGIENSRIFQKYLRGKLVFKPGEGHFNLEKGPQYKQFPELLEKILD